MSYFISKTIKNYLFAAFLNSSAIVSIPSFLASSSLSLMFFLMTFSSNHESFGLASCFLVFFFGTTSTSSVFSSLSSQSSSDSSSVAVLFPSSLLSFESTLKSRIAGSSSSKISQKLVFFYFCQTPG